MGEITESDLAFPSPSGVLIFLIHDKVYTKEPNLFPSPSGVLIFLMKSDEVEGFLNEGFRPLPGFLYS